MNKSNCLLLPSIMCVNWTNVSDDLSILNEYVEYFHWDILDGSFAPDFTMGSSIINSIREVFPQKGDYHLMVEEPARLYNSLGFSKGDRVCIHVECSKNLHRDISKLRELGLSPGVALSPATPLASLDYILEDIDRILILTVNPGYHSQPLVKQAISKIKDLSSILYETGQQRISIIADGNVNLSTIPLMYKSGAREFVLGKSGLFYGDISENITNIYNTLDTLSLSKEK